VKLKKIPVSGGTSVAICDLVPPTLGGATWATDDTIILADTRGLMRVPAAGGTPQPLLAADSKNGDRFSLPQLFPDGKSVLYTFGASSGSGVAVLDLKTGTHRVLINSGTSAQYAPSGHLVYRRVSTLFAAPFDLKRLAVIGPEVPVAEGVGAFTFSDSSLMVSGASGSTATGPLSKLEWIDRQGNSQPLTEAPQRWEAIAISPNGKLVAGAISDYESRPIRVDIWLYDLERHTLTRLTSDGHGLQPVWTHDGRWMTYGSDVQVVGQPPDGTKAGIYRVPADKSGPAGVAAGGFAYLAQLMDTGREDAGLWPERRRF
jgi:hypothetical protein